MSRLLYIVGASGVGKDSVMAYARDRLDPDAQVAFAHRYITRPADAGGENHIFLTRSEFRLRRSKGCFCLDWESHGHLYGVGMEATLWLAAGIVVVANGSRAYLPEARQRVRGLLPVEIRATGEVLADRLARRGRESPAEIRTRIERASALELDEPDVVVIDNSGPIEVAGSALLALIQATRLRSSEAA
jgi:ribose 1,5-bisphosphokinase